MEKRIKRYSIRIYLFDSDSKELFYKNVAVF